MPSHDSRDQHTANTGGKKDMSLNSQLPISQYIETIADLKDRGGHPAVARKARFCAKNIAKFDPATTIGDINRQWLDSYFSWLDTKGASRNTASNYAKIIRLAYREAVARNIATQQPQIFSGIFTGDAKPRNSAKKTTPQPVDPTEPRWYCLRCRRGTVNTEIAPALSRQPQLVDTFAPQVNEIHIRPDGTREIRPMAILSDLLFIRIAPADLPTALRPVADVAHIVRRCGSTVPAPITDYEMHMFRLVITNGTDGLSYIPNHAATVSPGDRVIVTAGLFRGLEGYANAISDGSRQITVRIQGICAVATPRIPCEFIRIISKA